MTQNSARLTLAIGFGSGFVGAALAVLLMEPRSDSAMASESIESVQPSAPELAPEWTGEPNAELAMGLSQLSQRFDLLEDRIAGLTRKPNESYITREELEELLAELPAEGVQIGPGAFEQPYDAAVQEQLIQAVRSAEKARASEKFAAQQQFRLVRVDRDVAAAGKALDLTSSQAENLRNALLSNYDRDQYVLELWEGGATDEVLGQVKQENSTLFQTELGTFLTEEQLGTYNSSLGGGGGK